MCSIEKMVTENMDVWTSSIEYKLAVRGQWVPQDPQDEPASVLLKNNCCEKKCI